MNGSIQSFAPNGNTEYVFPRWNNAQSVPAPVQEQGTLTRPNIMTVSGAGGGYNLRQNMPNPQEAMEVRLSFILIQPTLADLRREIDALTRAVYNRPGKLYRRDWEASAPGTVGTIASLSTRQFLNCICTSVEGQTEPNSIHGGPNPRWPVTLTFLATDPTWYEDYGNDFSPALDTEEGYDRSILRAHNVDGIAFNVSGDIENLHVFNRGTKIAHNLAVELAVTTGQVTQFTLENRTTEQEISVQAAIDPGESIIINNGTRQVTKDMPNDQYRNITLSHTQVDFLTLAIGANDLRFHATGTFTGILTFRLRMPYAL